MESLGGGEASAWPDLVAEVISGLHRIERIWEECWVYVCPCHVGVVGNEMADMAAKRALKREIEAVVVPGVLEWKSTIKRCILAAGQKVSAGNTRGPVLFN